MKKNSKTLLEQFHDYSCLTSERIIYFGSEGDIEGDENGVDYASAKKLIKNLLFLDSLSHKQITLYINTPGGCWYNGIAIYDIIKKIKSPVIGIGIGQVMSMGSIIIQACKYRYLTPDTTFMIHDGKDGFLTDTKSFENWGEYARKIRQNMYSIYLKQIKKKHPKFTLKQIEDMCSHDNIMTAEETVKLGLADKIVK